MTNAEVIEFFKKMHGLPSDNQLAIHYGVDRRLLSEFKRGVKPTTVQRQMLEEALMEIRRLEREIKKK